MTLSTFFVEPPSTSTCRQLFPQDQDEMTLVTLVKQPSPKKSQLRGIWSLNKMQQGIIRITAQYCHTRFLCQNRVLIVCMTQDQMFHTCGQKGSQKTKCHNIKYNYYRNIVFID
jgi:hypothetical protein